MVNTDKAYLFGLIVGGGHLSDRSLTISFPYRKWGEILENPERAGQIAKDILTKVNPVFKNEYKVNVSYRVQPNWRIYTTSITPELVNDLKKHGLPTSGDVRSVASIETLSRVMNEGAKRSFVAGLADSIGSLARSHRRFVDEHQIVSFEFKGNNFELVASLIKILCDINCVPDQVLWNHPNQHSGVNRYYKEWRKGFKIRVTLSDYIANGSFLFQAKSDSAKENLELQKGKNTEGGTENKHIAVEGQKTVHVDENDLWLPKSIRGYHFIHNQHLSAALGCETVPISDIKKHFDKLGELINPFTILTKGTRQEIFQILEKEDILRNRTYMNAEVNIEKWVSLYKKNHKSLLFSKQPRKGYPVSEVLQGLAYVLGSTIQKNVKGKRVLGNFIEFLLEEKDNPSWREISVKTPDRMTPLLITGKSSGALIGPSNPDVYNNLIQQEGEFLFRVRDIKEEDLV